MPPSTAPLVVPAWQRWSLLLAALLLVLGAVLPFVSAADDQNFSLLRLAGFHDGGPAVLGLVMLVALVAILLVMASRPGPSAVLPIVALVLSGIGLVMVLLRPGLTVSEPVVGVGAVLLGVALLGTGGLSITQLATRPLP